MSSLSMFQVTVNQSDSEDPLYFNIPATSMLEALAILNQVDPDLTDDVSEVNKFVGAVLLSK